MRGFYKRGKMTVDRTVNIEVDNEKCNGCGLCMTVCPSETLTLVDEKAKITGDVSLSCGHCIAICPQDAVSFKTDEYKKLDFRTFDLKDEWIGYGKEDVSHLTQLMLSRRSCRNFKEEEVKKEILDDLVKIGTTAPSGSNCQDWFFNVLSTKKDVDYFGQRICDFFKNLNKISSNAVLRNVLSLIGNKKLKFYFENYYETVKEKIEIYENEGIDKLFHGATAVIMVGNNKNSSCPSDDALLATQNILLGAHAMGIGTCLIGFAVNAVANDGKLKDIIGLKKDEAIYSVIALGYPKDKYRGLTVRKFVEPNYLSF